MIEFPLHRFRPVLASVFAYVILGSLLRGMLALGHDPASPVGGLAYALAFLSGLQQDLTVAMVLFTPMALFAMMRTGQEKWKIWGERYLRLGFLGFFWLILIFLFVAEFAFFDEFESRFNTVAIDYLVYPHEVLGNMDQSYPLGWILGGVVGATVVVAAGLRRFGTPDMVPAMTRRARLKWAGIWLAATGAALATTAMFPHPASGERMIDELAANGMITGSRAAVTRNLDYGAFYPTMPRNEAYGLVHEMVSGPDVTFFTSAPDELRRHVAGDATRPKLNVCLLLEESLGSEFWGSLGRKKRDGSPHTLTPHLDKIAAKSGMLFTNLYADGNRTIRGFEGVFASFPPLPGDSIVARDRSEDVETIGKTLKRDGYQTTFIYGGNSLFDGMGRFLANNGWDRCVEQRDFPHPVFTTAWGVCNEDLYGRAIEEMRAMHASGQPFLVTTLSVSNHRPYTYPAGRIKENPLEKRRDFAVKYTDWALGEFFRQAKREPFWNDTIFVVVADHGARVYGSEDIPIHSYEIPMLVVGPAVVKEPSRIDALGCQLDVAPTILGLIGRPYDSLFFGHDLRKPDAHPGQVFLNHNREIAGFSGREMAVFSLNRRVECYSGDPKSGAMQPCACEGREGMQNLVKQTTAVYQVADDLYMHRRYSLSTFKPTGS